MIWSAVNQLEFKSWIKRWGITAIFNTVPLFQSAFRSMWFIPGCAARYVRSGEDCISSLFFFIFQERVSMSRELSLDWDEEMATARPHDCASLPSNHPLYVLYTSGTTGTPKVLAAITIHSHAELCLTRRCSFCMQQLCDSSDLWACKTVQAQSKHPQHDINKTEVFQSVSWTSCRRNYLQAISNGGEKKPWLFSNSIILSLTNRWYKISSCWLVPGLNSAVFASFFFLFFFPVQFPMNFSVIAVGRP